MNQQPELSVVKVLDFLHIPQSDLIGYGGEGYVYLYDIDHVVKIYPKSSREYLKGVQKLQSFISSFPLPYKTSNILEINNIDSTFYTIELKLDGMTLDKKLETLKEKEKYKALLNFVEAVKYLKVIQVEDKQYGQIIKTSKSISSDSWSGYLIEKLLMTLTNSSSYLLKDVVDYQKKLELLKSWIYELKNVKKSLVHFDYYLNNVLVNDNLEITAILDFGTHTVVGDNILDLAGAISFLTLNHHITSKDSNILKENFLNEQDENIMEYFNAYTLYYSFYYSDDLINSYKWCIENLNNQNLWKF